MDAQDVQAQEPQERKDGTPMEERIRRAIENERLCRNVQVHDKATCPAHHIAAKGAER